ncbi:MAG: ParB/RepB/Spo0J family partition protein [Clostridia bacterium]|nr:ParB/RepB/Spo0J family partition protein [Clostridia bacterium]
MTVNFNGYMQNMCIDRMLIEPIPNNPFQPHDDDTMEMLTESIREFGVLDPIMVREIDKNHNHYQMISGRRRLEVCHRLGINQIPVRVVNVSEDEAIIAMVEANLCQRSDLLPSEKAAAYKMRLNAMKRQGYRTDLDADGTLSQVGTKLNSGTELSKTSEDSRTQIYRYIRLNELIPDLKQLVDERRIALGPAVELSYLPEEAQRAVFAYYSDNEVTPSYSQANQMKKSYNEGTLTPVTLTQILDQPKANQVEMFHIPAKRIRPFFKPNMSMQKVQDEIVKALEYYGKYKERQRRNRDAR